MTPAEVMTKLMGDPELAAAMNKPNVQKAIFEAKDNHMAVFKYQDDPEVMMARPTALQDVALALRAVRLRCCGQAPACHACAAACLCLPDR